MKNQKTKPPTPTPAKLADIPSAVLDRELLRRALLRTQTNILAVEESLQNLVTKRTHQQAELHRLNERISQR